jgi:hypothetical protein
MYAACGGAVGLVTLDVSPTTVNILAQPISEYTRTAWRPLFVVAVAALALATAALGVAAALAARPRPIAAAALILAALALGVVAALPCEPPHTPMTAATFAHWAASMTAFGLLPVAPITLARRRCRRPSRLSRLAGAFGTAGWVSMGILAVGGFAQYFSASWVPPIGGAVERVLVATELAAGLVLAVWHIRRTRRRRAVAPCVDPATAPRVDAQPRRLIRSRSVVQDAVGPLHQRTGEPFS